MVHRLLVSSELETNAVLCNSIWLLRVPLKFGAAGGLEKRRQLRLGDDSLVALYLLIFNLNSDSYSSSSLDSRLSSLLSPFKSKSAFPIILILGPLPAEN